MSRANLGEIELRHERTCIRRPCSKPASASSLILKSTILDT